MCSVEESFKLKINESIMRACTSGKTLIISDLTSSEITLKLFKESSRFVVLDAQAMYKKLFVKKASVKKIIEEAHQSIVFSVRFGKTMVVRIGCSMVDFVGTFCDECCETLEIRSKYPPFWEQSYLPKGFLLNGGSVLTKSDMLKKIFRREDLLDMICEQGYDKRFLQVQDLPNIGDFIVNGFLVVVTTTISKADIETRLLNGRVGLPGQLNDYEIVEISDC